jgi:hypothetical protein
MANTYHYRIYSLKATPTLGDLEKVITHVEYAYIGTNEDGVTSTYPGRTALPTPDSESFKPVEEISEEDIISWLDTHANLELMKSAIDAHIEQQAGIIYEGDTLPWASVEELPTSGSI